MVRRIVFILAVAVASFVGNWAGNHVVHAQAATPVFQITGSWSAHTACTTTPSQTTLCIASDGVWQSVGGAAYTQLGSGGVVSVNGKTGVVTISASTTATTTLN